MVSASSFLSLAQQAADGHLREVAELLACLPLLHGQEEVVGVVAVEVLGHVDHLDFVVALGLHFVGRKHILGLWEGATENATVCNSLASTNGIESCFSVTRKGCRNVKRWRSAEMAWRWAGSVLLHVEARFRRVRGFRDLGHLLAALGRSLDENGKPLDNRKEVA